MKFNFRKITSVLASFVMLGSTIGVAAAANYPAPFVSGGSADVAVVVTSGTHAGSSTDYFAAIDLGQSLQAELARQTATTTTSVDGSISGESTPLFNSATKIYPNSSINAAINSITSSKLPTVLADSAFSGNVDATVSHSIVLGPYSFLDFAKQPTSDDDPTYNLRLGTSNANNLYNATMSFSKAVNFTHSDSEGETVNLFGVPFTISSATDTSNIVLLKSSEKITLTSDDPISEVTIAGETYTVELVSASDTTATVRVTDSSGNSDEKTVTEEASPKKVKGLSIGVTNADETNLRLSATITLGAEKVTLTNGEAVSTGDGNDPIDGTVVTIVGGTGATTKITIGIYATGTDADAILAGGSYVDPIFGTFKVDFAGMNIPDNSETARETIDIKPSGDDKMQITLTDYLSGEPKTIQYAKNWTNVMRLQKDNDGRNISVREAESLHKGEYLVAGNELTGHLLEVYQLSNSSSTDYNNDKLVLRDVFSGDTYSASFSEEGLGTVNIDGADYVVKIKGIPNSDTINTTINFPDSQGANAAVTYPTFKSSKGALVAFYEPLSWDLTDWDGAGSDLTSLKFPDGDGYTDVTLSRGAGDGNFSVKVGSGTETQLNVSSVGSMTGSIGQLSYNFTISAADTLTVYLRKPTGGNIVDPAVVIIEEKDGSSSALYNALIVTTASAVSSGNVKVGAGEVYRTYATDSNPNAASTWEDVTLASDSDKAKEVDYYGAIVTTDSSDSNQKTVAISYPDEPVYAQLYVGEIESSVAPGTVGGGNVEVLGSVTVMDNQVDSVKDKNLIVVGGSCINTLAATLLDGKLCGADFQAKTGVGADQFLIEVFDSPYADGQVAMLVAGYEAADTATAVKYLTTETVSTEVGTKLKKVTATKADVE